MALAINRQGRRTACDSRNEQGRGGWWAGKTWISCDIIDFEAWLYRIFEMDGCQVFDVNQVTEFAMLVFCLRREILFMIMICF